MKTNFNLFLILTILIILFDSKYSWSQDLSNCGDQLIVLQDDNNGFSSSITVQVPFVTDCGCNSIGNCQKVSVKIPNNYTCQGLVVGLSNSLLWNDDFFDLYYLPQCQYQGNDNIQFSQKSNYLIGIDPIQTGGEFEFLICAGEDLPTGQNSVEIDITTSDLCTIEDCSNDTTPPTCNGNNFMVQLDPGQNYYTFDINDFVSDNCGPISSYEGAGLDVSTPNNGDLAFNPGYNEQFACGTYIVTNSYPFDNAGNWSDCAFTFEVECEGGDDLMTYSCYIGDTLNNYHSMLKHYDGYNYILAYTEINGEKYPNFSKISPQGDIEWSTRLTKQYQLFDFELLDNGYFLLIGRTEPLQIGNNWQNNKSALIQIKPNGAVFLERTYENNGRESFMQIERHKLPLNPDFPLYLLGFQNRDGDPPGTRDRVTLTNLDGNGNVNWSVKYINGNDDQFTRFLNPTSDGHLIIGGNVQISGTNTKSQLLKISGIDGSIIRSIRTGRNEVFRKATEIANSRLLVYSTITGVGYLNLYDLDLNLLSTYEVTGTEFKEITSISNLENGQLLLSGLKTGNRPTFVSIEIDDKNNIKFIDGHFIPESNSGNQPLVEVVGTNLVYLDSRTNLNSTPNSHDIVISQFYNNLPLECLEAFSSEYLISSTTVVEDQTSSEAYELPSPVNAIDARPNNYNKSQYCQTSDPCTSDTTPPICSVQDINVSLDANGQAIITSEMIDNGSVDSCSDVTLKIISQSTYGCNQLGINEVTLEVTDAAGNTSLCSAAVTIEDKTAPTCSTKNIEISVDAPGSATINANDIDNGSLDNCSIQSMSVNSNTFSCDDVGQNTVTLTLVDQSQNISTCTAIVSVLCNNPNPIWPGECETFESSTTQNWNTIAATLTIQDNGINGAGDMFLQVRDGSGASWAYNDVNFKGDYSQFGSTCICYDYLLINDAGDEDGIVSPRFFIYSGDPTAPDLQAGFYSTIEVTTDSGWTRVCATLGDCIDELPANDQGYWDMRIGDGCDDWNTLIHNVDGIQFFIDLTSSPSEVHAYDNICIEGCPTEPCESMTINMSTGYDPVSEGLINPLNLDPNWMLTAVPPDAGNIILPRPAYIISMYSAWTSQGGAQWISPQPISGYGINNCAARNCTCDPYTLQRCFCVPVDQNIAFDFSIFSDDKVEIYLIDNSSGGETLIASNCSSTPNHVGDPMIIDEEIFLKKGNYCIEARLYNTGGTAMGFNLQGSINGINLEKDICCMPFGRINGSVYNDLNCDGIRAQNSQNYIDPAIEGYTVTLCDNNGSAIEIVQTDLNGIYNFINIPEGDYIIKVQESPGFTYAPNTNGEVQINVSLQNTQIIDFGLCEEQSCCIDQNIFSEMYQNIFSVIDNGCGEVCLEMDLPIIDECDQIVINWGDGIKEEVSSGVDHKHKYEATEIYRICATIIRRDKDGKVCNQVEECFDITVDLEADGCGPCENEKDFCERVQQGFVLSQNGLQLLLTPASLNSSDVWVVNWGDGNNSNIYSDENATASNTYTNDGIYTVCMLVYSINADGKTCHEKTYCEKVIIKRPNSCCKDQKAFLDMVAKPFKISVKNCEVVINVPKLNDCIRAFISWGDGEVTGVSSSGSNYLHSYDIDATSAQVCINYEEVSGDRPCWKHRECFNIDLDCKGESCCQESESIIVNGSFTGLAGGNIDNNTSQNWQQSAHSPQINNSDGCENLGALQLWGNQYVSEQAQQSGITFTAGNTYRIQFCGKFRPHAQKLPTTGRIRLRASNTPLSNQQDCPAGDCEEIYVTGDLGTLWENICLPDWSPSNDYSILTISASNEYFIDDGYYVSFVLIDDLCIQEIETTVTNECCASPELLSQSVVSNVGASNIFCTEKDEVSLEVDGLLECQSVTKIWWGDGTSDDVTNNQIPLHTYMANGEWLIAVEVTSQASGGATCQTDIVEIPFVYKNCITSTKFEELDEQLLKLYPIPAKSQLTLSLSKNLNGYTGSIVNDLGQVIRSLDIGSGEIEQQIDLNGFVSGAYFIVLNDKSSQLKLMARFIKI